MVWPNSSSVDTMNEDSSAVICTYSTRKLHFFGSVEKQRTCRQQIISADNSIRRFSKLLMHLNQPIDW